MTETRNPTPAPPDLDTKTRFLCRPGSYTEPTAAVTMVETHMARVFLTDQHAYKMKKPVRSAFLDFSTLARRETICREELRLNRRLTTGVYLAVIPLLLDDTGALQPVGSAGGGGQGQGQQVVEWLVQMRRLPQARSLATRIGAAGAGMQAGPGESELAPLLALLVHFYRAAVPLEITPEAYVERLRELVCRHHRALLAPQMALPVADLRAVAGFLEGFTHDRADLLAQRADDRRIVEGHGDLRPEHCFLTSPPQVIDCLEFDRSLRCVDPLDELGYLALECELLGRSDLGEGILEGYRRACGDKAPAALEYFYKAYRALVRAHLAGAHLLDGTGGNDATRLAGDGQLQRLEPARARHWHQRTQRYLEAAQYYGRRASSNHT